MCDTFIALGNAVRGGGLVFGKNSDRPAGEQQVVESVSAQTFAPGSTAVCTHIQIPQVSRTLATLVSRPSFMWGAEMGANEAGVVIGNEAVFTNQPCDVPALTGMDLLRLALERSTSATEAFECIVELLETYGQGGPCDEAQTLCYSSSFLIADASHAWVLETAGQYWLAECIHDGTRSISNNLSIAGLGDRRHRALESTFQVGDCRWPDHDFAAVFTALPPDAERDIIALRESGVRERCRRAYGQFDVEQAQAILRDHEYQVCMHRKRFETRGSQVSRVRPGHAEHWFCERPFPCRQSYVRRDFVA